MISASVVVIVIIVARYVRRHGERNTSDKALLFTRTELVYTN